MDAPTILEHLAALNVEVTVDKGTLWLEPGSRVPADLLAEIRKNKAQLLQLLEADTVAHSAEVAWRVDAFRPQVPATGPIPTLGARPGTVFAAGSCTCCGDPLQPGSRYRCEPCVEAAWWVLRGTRPPERTP